MCDGSTPPSDSLGVFKTKNIVLCAEDSLLIALDRCLPSTPDKITLKWAYLLWYLRWVDFCHTVDTKFTTNVAKSLLNRGTMIRWAQQMGALDIVVYLADIEKLENAIISSEVCEVLKRTSEAVGRLCFPCSRKISDILLSGSLSEDPTALISSTRSLLLYISRISLNVGDACIEKWKTVEEEIVSHSLRDLALLTKTAQPLKLGTPARYEVPPTCLSAGACADISGLKGQPVKKCMQTACASKKVYRDLAKYGLIWPGKLEIREPLSKLITVPKSWKTRRVIVEEPVFQAWAQQAFFKQFAHAVVDRWGSSVDPMSPDWNRKNVSNPYYATIDLSSASDSISLDVAKAVLPPQWRRLILASSTRRTVLPNKEILTLRKVSGMGNAFTFPLECHVFATIVELARIRGNHPRERFGVYGDDILIPYKWYDDVIAALIEFGFTPNEGKSWTYPTAFRESCGCDYYDRVYCSPVRLARTFHETASVLEKAKNPRLKNNTLTRVQRSKLVGLVSHTNELHWEDSFIERRYLCDVLRRLRARFSAEIVITTELYGKIVFPALYSSTAPWGIMSSFDQPRQRLKGDIRAYDDTLFQWALVSKQNLELGYTEYPWVMNGINKRPVPLSGYHSYEGRQCLVGLPVRWCCEPPSN